MKELVAKIRKVGYNAARTALVFYASPSITYLTAALACIYSALLCVLVDTPRAVTFCSVAYARLGMQGKVLRPLERFPITCSYLR